MKIQVTNALIINELEALVISISTVLTIKLYKEVKDLDFCSI